MHVEYFTETDTLYIKLREVPGVDAREVAEDVVLDIGADGSVIGIEIEHASARTDINGQPFDTLPVKVI